MNNLPEEGKKIDETRVYTYDDHGNLTGSIRTYNDESGMQSETTYTYDDVGNRLTMQVDDELTEYEYNGLNQLVAMSSGDASTEYTYDDRGNQIKEETTVSADTGQDESEASTVTTDMEYSVTGQMISLTKSDGSTTTLTQENVYNHDGIRISREENGVKREYYYDGGTVAFTKDGNDISSVNILSPEGAAIGTYRGDDYYTYLNDIQGSTTNLVKSDGSLAAAYDYTDFGETAEITGNNFDNQVCYTGGIYDEETEFYYLNARYYDPATGRFISQDTYRGEMNDPGQWHLYAYCANNPINYVDPSGHVFRRTYTRNQCRNMYYQLCGIEKTISLIFAVHSLKKVTIKGIRKLIKNKKEVRKVIFEEIRDATISNFITNILTDPKITAYGRFKEGFKKGGKGYLKVKKRKL